MDIYTFFQFILMIAWEADGSKLKMEVAKQVERYGEDISLFCRVDNCCPESAGWIKWTSENEFSTIFIDVKHLIVDESSKYDGGTNERGFFLDIRKITRQDLNMKYSCTYGFEKSEKQLLLKTDVFFETMKTDDNDITISSRNEYLDQSDESDENDDDNDDDDNDDISAVGIDDIISKVVIKKSRPVTLC